MSEVKISVLHSQDGLAHPLFWAASAILLVNDHILKHAHVLPGTITGKLSDFAGMLVAPVLLAALLRVRGRGGRTAVFVCVAGVFTAIKLSRSSADVLETITAYTPLPWKLWCDPTDLVALSMLPLAWWLTLSVLLFCIGAFGVLARRNVILVIMSLELMLNAVNIALVAFGNYRPGAPGAGTIFALFIVTLAAAEVTVGLAIVIANYRNRRTVQTDQFDELKG